MNQPCPGRVSRARHGHVHLIGLDRAAKRNAFDLDLLNDLALAYEDKLILMEWFPVTSLMTTPQLSQYLESVQRHYQRLGVWLEFPEPQNKQRAA